MGGEDWIVGGRPSLTTGFETMSQPAARLMDLHLCPMQTPAVVPIPHVGGPILSPGEPTVLIAGLPAARVGDFCFCVGPPAPIVLGSFTVLVGGKPAARVGDSTAHGGTIMPPGCPTVLIGDSGGGAGSPAAFTMAKARADGAAFTRTTCSADGVMEQVKGSPLLAAADPTRMSWVEIELVDQKGKPVRHERYRVVPPGGKPVEGFLDDQGFARVNGIDPGTCVIGFPDLDAASWKPESGPPARPARPVPPVVERRPGVQRGSGKLVVRGRPGVQAGSARLERLRRPGVVPASAKLAVISVGPTDPHRTSGFA